MPSTTEDLRTDQRTPKERRAPALHSQTSAPNAASGYTASHLLPTASPQLTPPSSSHGRNSSPRTGPQDRPSVTTQATPQRMKNATKMSSRASRDSTSCSPSKVSSSPATQPSAVEPVSRRASRHMTRTISEPTTAAETRQPNGSIPKDFSPSALNDLPTSGWTLISGLSFHSP